MAGLALRRVFLPALLCLSVVASGALAADDYLSAEQIEVALSDRIVRGNQDGVEWRQSFSAGGATIFSQSGRESPGRWAARSDAEGGLYCSLWPPSERWDCYRMRQDGDSISWEPLGGGDLWLGQLLPR